MEDQLRDSVISFTPTPGDIPGVIGYFLSAVVYQVRADAVDKKSGIVMPINQLLARERIGEGFYNQWDSADRKDFFPYHFLFPTSISAQQPGKAAQRCPCPERW